MNGYNFTERVRKVLALSREAAAELRHDYVGTEHMLLGLLHEGEGVAATALRNLGVSAPEMVRVIHDTVKTGRDRSGSVDLPYTSRAKKVLELAMKSARDLHHSYVGTEHLLLGLLAEEKGIAAQVLVDGGIRFDTALAEIQRILGGEMPASETIIKPRLDRPAPSGPVSQRRMARVVADAKRLAGERGCDAVSAWHLVLAMLASGGRAVTALRLRGVDLDQLALDVDTIAPRGAPGQTSAVAVPLSTALEGTLSALASHPDRWQASPPDTGDVLLALLQSDPALASLFVDHGLPVESLRATLAEMLG